MINPTRHISGKQTPGGCSSVIQYYFVYATNPAIDTADNEGCLSADRRGEARPQGAGCDVGVFELDFGSSGSPPVEEPTAVAPTPMEPLSINFNVDSYSIYAGQCTRLRREVLNADSISLEGEDVQFPGSGEVCPSSTQTYSVTLVWVDAADNEDGNRVYREGSLIALLGANVQQYTDNPPDGGPHTYGVGAFNASGTSSRPDVVSRWKKSTPISRRILTGRSIPGS